MHAEWVCVVLCFHFPNTFLQDNARRLMAERAATDLRHPAASVRAASQKEQAAGGGGYKKPSQSPRKAISTVLRGWSTAATKELLTARSATEWQQKIVFVRGGVNMPGEWMGV